MITNIPGAAGSTVRAAEATDEPFSSEPIVTGAEDESRW